MFLHVYESMRDSLQQAMMACGSGSGSECMFRHVHACECEC